MPSATSTPQTVLPPAAVRDEIASRLGDFVDAILAHPSFQPPRRHVTLMQVWDFAMRTKYILSELENVEAGRAVQFPDQIPDYNRFQEGKRDPEKADELMTDVKTRSITLDMMVRGQDRTILRQMGLADLDFGADLKAKSKALLESLPDIN